MPSSFRTPLRLEFLDDTRFQLIDHFEFLSEVTESIIRVPSGFVTDFASIPRGLWNILPPTGFYGKAAVVHDWLYQTRDAGTHRVWRADADAVLLEGMKALMQPSSSELRAIDMAPESTWADTKRAVRRAGRLAQRWAIYAGIRLGGWVAWNNYRRQDPPR